MDRNWFLIVSAGFQYERVMTIKILIFQINQSNPLHLTIHYSLFVIPYSLAPRLLRYPSIYYKKTMTDPNSRKFVMIRVIRVLLMEHE